MKKLIISASIFAMLINCAVTPYKSKNMAEQKDQAENPLSQEDTTPKVTGIGGIFFFSENPEKTREWYSENLGLEVNQ